LYFFKSFSALKLSSEPCDTPIVAIKKKQIIVIKELSVIKKIFDNMIKQITNNKKNLNVCYLI
jgi:hypothetical protein